MNNEIAQEFLRPVHRLPLDIWFKIAPALARRDLMALCATSSHFLATIRPLFYRVVELRSDSGGSRTTVNLLARDKSLASFVLELVLVQHILLLPGTRRGPVISSEALSNMTSLKRITFCGIVFKDPSEQHEFGSVLQLKTRTTLEQVTYQGLAYAEWWPSDRLGLGGLEVIEWDARGKDGMQPFWNLLSESQQSCHTLRLPLWVLEDDLCRTQLRSVHLPNLRSISIIPPTSATSHRPTRISHHAVEYLLSHDGVEELNMLQLSTALSTFRPYAWPHLRSLATTASILRAMKAVHMNCLSTTLRRLILHFDFAFIRSPSFSDVSVFFDLSELQEIDMVFPPEVAEHFSDAMIRRCAESCVSSLKVWRGNVGHVGTRLGTIPATIFKSLTKLRVIDFTGEHESMVLGRHSYDHICTRSVRRLAKMCPDLGEVWAIHYFTTRRHCWVVVRMSNINYGPDTCDEGDCDGHAVHVEV